MMKRPRPAFVVLLLSLALLIATPFVVAGTSSTDQVEAVGVRPVPTTTPTPFVPGEPQFRFERVETKPRVMNAAPIRVRIPAIGVDAPILATGVASDGQAEVPEDVMTVGWYRFGQRPADDQGATVLIAHRDGRVEGPGIFYRLDSLRVGALIKVTDQDGTVHEYTVTSREAIDKGLLPVEELFTRSGDPMLVLISCGGSFIAGQGGYQSNVVVTAQPSSGRS
jgi:LPXTG-site transpeptidase (sortase) family protein